MSALDTPQGKKGRQLGRGHGCRVCGNRSAVSFQVRIAELSETGHVGRGCVTRSHSASLCEDCGDIALSAVMSEFELVTRP